MSRVVKALSHVPRIIKRGASVVSHPARPRVFQPMPARAAARAWMLLSVFLLSLGIPGCHGEEVRPQSFFETAENAYRVGDYETAHQYYSLFLRQAPDPQLARLAERRMITIEREIECVLGQKSGPRVCPPGRDARKCARPVSARPQSEQPRALAPVIERDIPNAPRFPCRECPCP